MNFKNSQDNHRLIDRLENVVKTGRVSHAYIFEGSKDFDKLDFAKSFVKGVLCPNSNGINCGRCSLCEKIDHDNCEDLIYISKENQHINKPGTSVKNDEIKYMQGKLNFKPNSDRHVVIIDDSDTMTVNAQNSLLKTLEEPPEDAVIILLADNIENLTQTILSRCVKYRLYDFSSGSNSEASKLAGELIEMTLNKAPYYLLNEKLETVYTNREKAVQTLDAMEIIYRDYMIEKKKGEQLFTIDEIDKCIFAVEDAKKKLQQGMSVKYILKNLLLVIGG